MRKQNVRTGMDKAWGISFFLSFLGFEDPT